MPVRTQAKMICALVLAVNAAEMGIRMQANRPADFSSTDSAYRSPPLADMSEKLGQSSSNCSISPVACSTMNTPQSPASTSE